MELPVVNHKDYEAQLNDDNKFPIKKFGELAKALIKNKNKRKYAAKDLGISERTLYRKIKHYNLDKDH